MAQRKKNRKTAERRIRDKEIGELKDTARQLMPLGAHKTSNAVADLETAYARAAWMKREWDIRHPDDPMLIVLNSAGTGYYILTTAEYNEAAEQAPPSGTGKATPPRQVLKPLATGRLSPLPPLAFSIGNPPLADQEADIAAAESVGPSPEALGLVAPVVIEPTPDVPPAPNLVVTIGPPPKSSPAKPAALRFSQIIVDDSLKPFVINAGQKPVEVPARKPADGARRKKDLRRAKRKQGKSVAADCQALRELAAEEFPGNQLAQSQWALQEFKELYPICPPHVKPAEFNRQRRTLHQIRENGEATPAVARKEASGSRPSRKPQAVVTQGNVPAPPPKPVLEPEVVIENPAKSTVLKAEATVGVSPPLVAEESVDVQPAPISSMSKVSLDAARQKKLRQAKPNKGKDLSDDRKLLAELAAEAFPADQLAQSEEALDVFDMLYPECPPEVKLATFKRHRAILYGIRHAVVKPAVPPQLPDKPVHTSAVVDRKAPVDDLSPSPNAELETPAGTPDKPKKRIRRTSAEIHDDVILDGLLTRSDRKAQKRHERELYRDRDILRRQAAERFPTDPQAQSSWAIEEFANLWGQRTHLVSEAALYRVERQLHALRPQKPAAPVAVAVVVEKVEELKVPRTRT